MVVNLSRFLKTMHTETCCIRLILKQLCTRYDEILCFSLQVGL